MNDLVKNIDAIQSYCETAHDLEVRATRASMTDAIVLRALADLARESASHRAAIDLRSVRD